jgi:hypothetical protein
MCACRPLSLTGPAIQVGQYRHGLAGRILGGFPGVGCALVLGALPLWGVPSPPLRRVFAGALLSCCGEPCHV